MEAPVSLPMASIYPAPNGRAIQRDKVALLAESIGKLGLKTPITVRETIKVADGREIAAFEIVAGRHRYEAALSLHWREIDCFVLKGTEIDARLWEIAENLHRAELTAQERADLVAEWVELVSGNLPKTPREGRPGAISAASRSLGIERTEVRRAVKIAATAPEAKDVARESGLADNQSALLKIASEPTAQAQVVKAREIAAAKSKVRMPDDPRNEFEVKAAWLAAGMSWWNKGAREWREEFLERIEGVVFDNTRAGAA